MLLGDLSKLTSNVCSYGELMHSNWLPARLHSTTALRLRQIVRGAAPTARNASETLLIIELAWKDSRLNRRKYAIALTKQANKVGSLCK